MTTFMRWGDGGMVLHYDVANTTGHVFKSGEWSSIYFVPHQGWRGRDDKSLEESRHRLQMRLVLLKLGVLTV
jgi:hypothetical protein